MPCRNQNPGGLARSATGIGTQLRPLAMAAWLSAAALAAGGCGGSGGSAGDGLSSSPAPPPPAAPNPPGSVVYSVKVIDAFGVPVAGAKIDFFASGGSRAVGFSDATGHAEAVAFADSIYAVQASASQLRGYLPVPSSSTEGRREFVVTMHPASPMSGGIGKLAVTGVSQDGRTLSFNARLLVIESVTTQDSDLEDWNYGSVALLDCSPEGGAPFGLRSPCITAPARTDAPYQAKVVSRILVQPVSDDAPAAVSLLLDQGRRVVLHDPADQRLLAARYLQTRLADGDQVAIAAFAAYDPASGEAALLQDQPLTILPADAPGFKTGGRSLFPAIDSLASLEAGASPLHEALGAMIDFTATHAPEGSQRAIVALVSDLNVPCIVDAGCRSRQQALLEQSVATGVPLVVVGLADSTEQLDPRTLAAFAQSATGMTIWARYPSQLPTIVGRVPQIVTGRHLALDVSVELTSLTDGAFASGATVSGTVRVAICPWDCDESVDIPFALRIP